MVWTLIETDFLFLDDTQMGLSIPVQAALQLKGNIDVDDLLYFDDDKWKMVSRNLKNWASTMSFAQPKTPPVLI